MTVADTRARLRRGRAGGMWIDACLLLSAVATAGCGYRFQPGLASVPAANRPWTDDDFAHDVIANGDESCPRAGSAEQDRLFLRWPPCERAAPPRKRRAPPHRLGPLEPLDEQLYGR